MFKYIASALIMYFALGALPARAQMADRLSEYPRASKSGAEDVVAITREMANRLHLNEGQFLKLLPLNRTKLAGMNRIDRECRNDEATKAARAAELEAQYEQECSHILSPSQLSQLQQEKGQTAPVNSGNGLG